MSVVKVLKFIIVVTGSLIMAGPLVVKPQRFYYRPAHSFHNWGKN